MVHALFYWYPSTTSNTHDRHTSESLLSLSSVAVSEKIQYSLHLMILCYNCLFSSHRTGTRRWPVYLFVDLKTKGVYISSINYPLVYYSFLLKPVRHVPIESILYPVYFWLLQEQLVLITCMTLQFQQLLSQLLPTHSTCQPVRHVPIESTLLPSLLLTTPGTVSWF